MCVNIIRYIFNSDPDMENSDVPPGNDLIFSHSMTKYEQVYSFLIDNLICT